MFIRYIRETWSHLVLVLENAHIDENNCVIPMNGIDTPITLNDPLSVWDVLHQCHFVHKNVPEDSDRIPLTIDGRELTFRRSMAEDLFGTLDRFYWDYLEATNPEMAALLEKDRLAENN